MKKLVLPSNVRKALGTPTCITQVEVREPSALQRTPECKRRVGRDPVTCLSPPPPSWGAFPTPHGAEPPSPTPKRSHWRQTCFAVLYTSFKGEKAVRNHNQCAANCRGTEVWRTLTSGTAAPAHRNVSYSSPPLLHCAPVRRGHPHPKAADTKAQGAQVTRRGQAAGGTRPCSQAAPPKLPAGRGGAFPEGTALRGDTAGAGAQGTAGQPRTPSTHRQLLSLLRGSPLGLPWLLASSLGSSPWMRVGMGGREWPEPSVGPDLPGVNRTGLGGSASLPCPCGHTAI